MFCFAESPIFTIYYHFSPFKKDCQELKCISNKSDRQESIKKDYSEPAGSLD